MVAQATPAAANMTFISQVGLLARMKEAMPKAEASRMTPPRMVFFRPMREAS